MGTSKIPKVPSLQHLARIWDPDPERIKKTLVKLALNGPTFSYQLMYELIEDLIHSKIPYEQIETAVRSRVAREHVRNNFLELLPLIRDQLVGINASYVHRVSPRYYPIGRGVVVPFAPPFVYGEEGCVHMPWFSFWKNNPLSGRRLSLFMTVVDEILSQDPDLDEAAFRVLDFSVDEVTGERAVVVLRSSEIERIDRKELAGMLATFVEGFDAACRELESLGVARRDPRLDDSLDVDQLGLFD